MRKSSNQRNGKNKAAGKKVKKSQNSNSSNEFYSAVVKSPTVSSKKPPKPPTHTIPYATVQATNAYSAGETHQDKPKGIVRTISTFFNRLLTVAILIVFTYYILRGCDASKTKSGRCTAIDPIKQDLLHLLDHDMYKMHIEPYTDSMMTWSTDQARMLQTVAMDRATHTLDRAKLFHASVVDHAKTIQTFVHHQLNSLQPTASDQDDYDDYYSATMTPYETQLPHKEIQAILAAAKLARTRLDDQLRTVQKQLQERLIVTEMKHARVVGDGIKGDMESLRRTAENQVIQRAKEARQAVVDENELTAVRQAERQALLEVRKSDVLIDEIRLEIDHSVEATVKRWKAAR